MRRGRPLAASPAFSRRVRPPGGFSLVEAGSKISRRFLMTIVQRDSVHDDCRAAHLRETDCVAGHVRFELRNVVASYPFERSDSFAGI
jgi:hypothetical protein